MQFVCTNQIRNGKYACFWRVKLDNLRFAGNWKVGIDVGGMDDSKPSANLTESYSHYGQTIHYSHKENSGILSSRSGSGNFVYIYFGNLLLDGGVNNLQFSLTQKTNGARGISFDCIELYELTRLSASDIDDVSEAMGIPADSNG